MSDPTHLFFAFIAIGLLLLGLEIIVPGGILGFFGGLSLLGAIAVGFVAFGPQGGGLAAVAVVLLSAALLGAWLKLLPRTKMGKVLTLSSDGSAFKAVKSDARALVGKEGVALTNLHLAGIAQIDGKRIDVVAESSFIDAGSTIRVVKVEGNRIVVRQVKAPSPETGGASAAGAV